MKQHIPVLLLSSLALSLTSCCQLCLKSFAVEPVWQNVPAAATGATAPKGDLSAKATLTFDQCPEAIRCEAIKGLNAEMRETNKHFEEGRLTTAEYLREKNTYAEKIVEISKGATVIGTLPKPEKPAGAASMARRGPASVPAYSSDRANQLAQAADIIATTEAMRARRLAATSR